MTMYNIIIFKNGEAMNSLTVLLENTQAELKSVSVEHGLSLLLRIDDKSFLFDTGATGIFTGNARLMNVPLDDVECVVISHSHYDHAGGFASFAETYRVRELVTGPDFFLPKYNFLNGAFTYLGASFDKAFLTSRGIAYRECCGCLQLTDSLYAFSGFARTHAFETIPERFVKGVVGNTVPDFFDDEVCLVYDGGSSLRIIVGCSHPGILNMTASVAAHFDKPVSAVYGGSHLVEADDERIRKTIEELQKKGVRKTGFCHCSGNRVHEIIAETNAVTDCRLATGSVVVL